MGAGCLDDSKQKNCRAWHPGCIRRLYAQQPVGGENTVYENGSLRIDYAAGCGYLNGSEIHLTPIEYKMLCLLAKNTGKVLRHNSILKEIRGNDTASDVGSL